MNVPDEAYEHLVYLFKYIEGVEIVEDSYIQENNNKDVLA